MASVRPTLQGGDVGTRWAATTAVPLTALRDFVLGYAGFEEMSGQPVLRRELPSSALVLVLNVGEPLTVARTTPGARASAPRAFVAGIGLSSVNAGHSGHHITLEVRLSPLAASPLFGVPASLLAEQIVDLAELWGPAASELVERTAAAARRDRFEIVEHALLARVRSIEPSMSILAGALEMVLERGGDLPIADLQILTGWSRHRLAGEFREHVGLTPKALARLVRFRRAEHTLRQPSPPSLASVALTCGYCDQAHFNREFRELVSCTPTEHLARVRADIAGSAMSQW